MSSLQDVTSILILFKWLSEGKRLENPALVHSHDSFELVVKL